MFDSLFPSHWTTLRKLMWLKLKGASAVWDTITGNPVSFSAKAAPLRQLKVAFSPKQEGTGDPSPDNVRPISGWPSLTVEQRGKNLLNFDSTKVTTGETTTGTTRAYYPLGIRNCILTFSASLKDGETPTTGIINIGKRLANGKIELLNSYIGQSGIRERTFTFAENEEPVLMSSTSSGTVLTNDLPTKYNVMVELGETAHDFVPYNGRTISISLGQTVYSGTVDVVTGVGEVTMASVLVSGLTWDYYNGLFYSNVVGKANRNPSINVICSAYASGSRSATGAGDAASMLQDKQITGFYDPNSSNSWIYIKDSDYATAASFKTAMGDTQIVYELATPIPIQLTPQEVQSLAGDNTMWSDANGDLTVEYRSN